MELGDLKVYLVEMIAYLKAIDRHLCCQNNIGASGLVTVTPDDSADLPGGVTSGIRASGGGTIKATFANGSIGTFTIAANTNEPFYVQRVWSSGTTATGITALY